MKSLNSYLEPVYIENQLIEVGQSWQRNTSWHNPYTITIIFVNKNNIKFRRDDERNTDIVYTEFIEKFSSRFKKS